MVSLSIKGLTKAYGGSAVISGLDLTLADGEFLTLLGPSGCGKTTTLRCIAGLERPDRGEIEAGGDVFVSATRHVYMQPERRNVGVVFQSYALWPHMTVYGNVAYPLRCRRVRRPEIMPRVTEALQLVGLESLMKRPVSALSGGQQQRVALARALVGEPQLLLFDEPLSNLDAALRASVRSEIQSVHSRLERTSVYVTHDQVEALTLSDRVAVMNAGRIEQIGSPREVYSSPRSRFVAEFLGYENIFSGEVCGREGDRLVVRPSGSAGVLLTRATGTASGTRTLVAVRASSVGLSRSPFDGPNSFSGTVRRIAYLGDQVEAVLDTTYGELCARVPTDQVASGGGTLFAGEELFGRVAPDGVVCLADEVADTAEMGSAGAA